MNENEYYSLFCIKKSVKRGGTPPSWRLTLPLDFARNSCVCSGFRPFFALGQLPGQPGQPPRYFLAPRRRGRLARARRGKPSVSNASRRLRH